MRAGGAIDIVKQGGKRPSEAFDRKKLHASIIAACLSVRTPSGQAEAIADAVTDQVMQWLEARSSVTSHDLRRIAAQHLQTHHPDAAYLYEQHRITL